MLVTNNIGDHSGVEHSSLVESTSISTMPVTTSIPIPAAPVAQTSAIPTTSTNTTANTTYTTTTVPFVAMSAPITPLHEEELRLLMNLLGEKSIYQVTIRKLLNLI